MKGALNKTAPDTRKAVKATPSLAPAFHAQAAAMPGAFAYPAFPATNFAFPAAAAYHPASASSSKKTRINTTRAEHASDVEPMDDDADEEYEPEKPSKRNKGRGGSSTASAAAQPAPPSKKNKGTAGAKRKAAKSESESQASDGDDDDEEPAPARTPAPKKTKVAAAKDGDGNDAKRLAAQERSSAAYAKRGAHADLLHAALEEETGDTLVLKHGITNRITNDERIFEHDPGMTPERSFQRHMSTVALAAHGEGIEFQASMNQRLSKTGARLPSDSVILSSNVNRVNRAVEAAAPDAAGLKDMAVERIRGAMGKKRLSARQIGADRTLRHAYKFLRDAPQMLTDDARLTVPDNVSSKDDGKHAELRVIDSPTFSPERYLPPAGTKLPCVGCVHGMHKHKKQVALREEAGGMWTSKAATHSLRAAGITGAEEQAEAAAAALSAAGAKMGLSRTRSGNATADHDADTDDEQDMTQAEIDQLNKKHRIA